VIAVVSRDILIIGAFILSWMLSRPVTVYPLLVSKTNTVAQLVLASLVLAELGLGLGLEPFVAVCIWITGALTILSAIVYFWVWLKHMASYEPQPVPPPARRNRKPIKTEAGSRVRTS
jgi:cardiolipin synthase